MTGDRTTTDSAVGMKQPEGMRNALKTPPDEAVERLEKAAARREAACRSTARHWKRAGRDYDEALASSVKTATVSVPLSDLRTVLSHLRQVEEREAVMREALTYARYHVVNSPHSDRPAALKKIDAALTHSPETDGEG